MDQGGAIERNNGSGGALHCRIEEGFAGGFSGSIPTNRRMEEGAFAPELRLRLRGGWETWSLSSGRLGWLPMDGTAPEPDMQCPRPTCTHAGGSSSTEMASTGELRFGRSSRSREEAGRAPEVAGIERKHHEHVGVRQFSRRERVGVGENGTHGKVQGHI